MSNAVSALNGASYTGFAAVEELGLQGMITLRGDFSSAPMKAAVKAATGLSLPKQREILHGKGGSVAWMSPDELMILVDYDQAESTLEAIGKSLKGKHFLAENVSDARVVFQVKGAKCREVLAKLSPVDLSAGAFEPGQIRRTRMAQIAAAFWMQDAETIQIICFRSVADYAFGLLKNAAAPGGEVGYLV